MEDLPLPEAQQAETAYAELNNNWEEAMLAGQKSGKPPTLMKVGWGSGGGSRRGQPGMC